MRGAEPFALAAEAYQMSRDALESRGWKITGNIRVCLYNARRQHKNTRSARDFGNGAF